MLSWTIQFSGEKREISEISLSFHDEVIYLSFFTKLGERDGMFCRMGGNSET